MKLIGERWHKLYRSRPGEWTRELLAEATGDELEALCRLLGVAYSGTKEARIARLIDMAELRRELASWGEYATSAGAHQLGAAKAQSYTKARLVSMCRRAGLFTSTTKAGLAVGLLRWRDACRQRGQAFDEELRRTATRQYRMF